MSKSRVPFLIALCASGTWFVYYRIEQGQAGCCWPETFISSGVVALLALPLAMALFGRWHPLIGAIPAGLFAFALTAPTYCAHGIANGPSGGSESVNCDSIIGLSLSSYTTSGEWPPYRPAGLIGLGVAILFFLLTRRRYRQSHLVD